MQDLIIILSQYIINIYFVFILFNAMKEYGGADQEDAAASTVAAYKSIAVVKQKVGLLKREHALGTACTKLAREGASH